MMPKSLSSLTNFLEWNHVVRRRQTEILKAKTEREDKKSKSTYKSIGRHNPLFVWVGTKSSLFCFLCCCFLSISCRERTNHLSVYLDDFLGSKTAWMFGKTPPLAIVTPPSKRFNSSSFFTASVI